MGNRSAYGAVAIVAVLLAVLFTLLLGGDGAERVAIGPEAVSEPDAEEPASAAVLPSLPEGELESVDLRRTAAPEDVAPPRSPEAAAPRDGFDPRALFGVVVDDDAAPVEGATVRLLAGERVGARDLALLAVTTADAEGRFRFEGLERARGYLLSTNAPPHLPDLRRSTSGVDTEIRLRRAARLRGRVLREPELEPVPGARVFLESLHLVTEGRLGRLESHVETFADDDGFYELPSVRLDRPAEILVQDGPTGAVHRTRFQVDPDRWDGYDVWIRSETTLVLELFDASTKDLLEEPATINGTELEPGNDGRIHFGSEAASRRDMLVVEVEGYCQTALPRPPSSAPQPMRVPMLRGASVRGRVVDTEGTPVQGARVVVRGTGAPETPAGFAPDQRVSSTSRAAFSDEDGRFELNGLAPFSEVALVRASHAEFAVSDLAEIDLRSPGAEAEVELVLGAPGVVEGVVLLDGEPASVQLEWEAEDDRGSTHSNDEGFYRLRGLPPGDLRLHARFAGGWRRSKTNTSEEHHVQVLPDELVRYDFEVWTDRVPIAGRVIDPRGEPEGGVRVVAEPGEGKRASAWARTSGDGSFRLLVPPDPGARYRVLAITKERRTAREGVLPGTEGLELVLADVGFASLRVVDAFTREPLHGVRVYYREHPDLPLAGPSGKGGLVPGPEDRFLQPLPEGTFELVVAAGSGRYVPAWLERVRIVRDERTELTVALEPGGTVTLAFEGDDEVLGLLREQWRKSRIFLYREDQRAERDRGGPFFGREVRGSQTLRALEGDRTRVTGLAPGRYAFSRFPRGLRPRPASIEVEPREHQTVRIRVERVKKKGNKGGGAR